MLENGEQMRDKSGRYGALVLVEHRGYDLWKLVIKCTAEGEPLVGKRHSALQTKIQKCCRSFGPFLDIAQSGRLIR